MGNSSFKTVALTQLNESTATVFTNVSLSCSNDSQSNQSITVECQPQLNGPVDDPNTLPYESNLAAADCVAAVVTQASQYYDLQRATWTNGGSIQVQKPIDQDYNEIVQQMIACGSRAKACVYQNISQGTVIKNVLSCQSFLTIQNTLTQAMSTQVQQMLTNNQDALSPLAQLLGASTSDQIVNNITSRMVAKITNEVIAGIQNTIQNNQTLVLENSTVKGTTQQSAFTSITQYLAKTDLYNTIFTDQQWNELQDLYDDTSTVDALGNVITRSIGAIEAFLKSSVGYVVIFTLGLVGLVFISLVIFFIVRKIRNVVKNSQEKHDLEMAEWRASVTGYQGYP